MISKNMENNSFEKDVWITIKSINNDEPEGMEFVTEGKLIKDDLGYTIKYDESEIMGENGVITSLSVIDDIVTLDRSGKVDTRLVFTKGKTQSSKYATKYGVMNISVFTNDMKIDVSDKGGTIKIEYLIDFFNEEKDKKFDVSENGNKKYIDLTIKEANN